MTDTKTAKQIAGEASAKYHEAINNGEAVHDAVSHLFDGFGAIAALPEPVPCDAAQRNLIADKDTEDYKFAKPKRELGLYGKFTVSRNDGSSLDGGRHFRCDYFVLDLTHDKHAPPALRAYADSCEADGFGPLAAALRRKADKLAPAPGDVGARGSALDAIMPADGTTSPAPAPLTDAEFGITGYIRDSDQCAAAIQPSNLTASVALRFDRVTMDFRWTQDDKFLAQFEFPRRAWDALVHPSLTDAERARLAQYDALRDRAAAEPWDVQVQLDLMGELARVGRGEA